MQWRVPAGQCEATGLPPCKPPTHHSHAYLPPAYPPPPPGVQQHRVVLQAAGQALEACLLQLADVLEDRLDYKHALQARGALSRGGAAGRVASPDPPPPPLPLAPGV